MKTTDLLEEIALPGSDLTAFADRLIAAKADLSMLIEGMKAKPGRVKFGCQKVLQKISEKRPERVYPYFLEIAAFLEGENKILRWGAINILANLAAVDSGNHFGAQFDRFYRSIPGPDMITAANVIGASPKIARAHPELTERIVAEILKVETAVYKTAECRNVAIGHALDAFEDLDESIKDKPAVLAFAQRQLRNPRRAVAERARKFLAGHDRGAKAESAQVHRGSTGMTPGA